MSDKMKTDDPIAAAEAEYAKAQQRTAQLSADVVKAREAAAKAAARSSELLNAVARADDGTVSDDHLLEADQAALRAVAVEKLATAKHAAAVTLAHEAQVRLFAAKAKEIEADYSAAVDALIGTAEAVDCAKAELDESLSAYARAYEVVRAAWDRAQYHNGHELNPDHNMNEVLRRMEHWQKPRAEVVPGPHNGGVPMSDPLRAEVGYVYGRGTIYEKRMTVEALEQRVRSQFNRPVDHRQ